MVGGLIVNAAPARVYAGGGGAAGAMFPSSSTMEPAGHGRRIVARIVDGLVQSLIILVGAVPILFLSDTLGPIGVMAILVTVLAIAFLVYDPYFIATKGATPGKSAMGLRVVSQDGGAVGVGQAIGRLLLMTICEVFLPLMMVPLFTERRQGLYDMVVGTYVVQA
jgi:uncharacterized RDD family membrane protein YckC